MPPIEHWPKLNSDVAGQVVVQRGSGCRVEVIAPAPLHMRRALCALFGPNTADDDSRAAEQRWPPELRQVPDDDALISDSSSSSSSSSGPSIASRHASTDGSLPDMQSRSGRTRAQASVHGEERPGGAAGRPGAEVAPDYGVRQRWSHQRRAEARAGREAVASMKQEKKRQKTARKGRRTQQRARAELHTVRRPLRRF